MSMCRKEPPIAAPRMIKIVTAMELNSATYFVKNAQTFVLVYASMVLAPCIIGTPLV